MKRVRVNGLDIYPFTSTNELIDFVESKRGILVAVNSKKIKGANAEICNIVNNNIGYADGVGALIALKYKGIKNPVKVPGCELWLNIIKRFYQSKTFYLIGGKQNVIETVVDNLKKDFPGIKILNYRNGYLKTEEERTLLLRDIQAKKPDVVFVAMGSPMQEYLMQDLHKIHPAIYQGLGGSFDVYTGTVRRAPKWFSDHGLEGPYRAFWEPLKRIKGVITDIYFLVSLFLGKY